MVRVYGLLRSKTTETIEVQAPTVEEAKATVLAGLPADTNVIEFRNESHGNSPATLHATTRSTATVSHDATGDHYETVLAQ
ncbi:hypothetical protein ACO2Q7_17160 [Rathayibacter sp. KR2-224]|uniref:hypothetical protein n=1 Tax=Rathayibacter sp. KR2-224 TaxID=3400913 RepID=UPI003C03BCD3